MFLFTLAEFACSFNFACLTAGDCLNASFPNLKPFCLKEMLLNLPVFVDLVVDELDSSFKHIWFFGVLSNVGVIFGSFTSVLAKASDSSSALLPSLPGTTLFSKLGLLRLKDLNFSIGCSGVILDIGPVVLPA